MGDNALAIHADPSGSVRLLTGADGSAVNRLSYEAFGQIRSESGTVSSPLGFAGQPRDLEAGLSFFWGRALDPYLGQFASVDPINVASVSWLYRDPTNERDQRDYLLINPPAQHPYAYAHHNPLRYEDPLGLAANCSGDRSWWDDLWWTINRLWGHTTTLTGIGLVDWVTDIIGSDDPNRAAGEAARDLIPSEDVRDAYDDFMDFPNSTRR